MVTMPKRLPKSTRESGPSAQVPGEAQKCRSWPQGIEGGTAIFRAVHQRAPEMGMGTDRIALWRRAQKQ